MTVTDNERAPTLFDKLNLGGMTGTLLLIVLVVACYGATTSYSYIWDDDTYIVNNLNLRDLAGLSRMWTHIGATPQYYPITFTSFWIEYQLFGPNAARPSIDRLISVAHGVNLLLHLASVLMLWTILKRLAVPGALLAAAIFAVHPLNVESVAWVAERKNTLSLMFGMAALLVYLRYIGIIAAPAKPASGEVKKSRTAGEGQDDETDEGIQFSLPEDPRRLYALFLVLFVCALLSKTTLAVLPGVILVIIWWKRGRLVVKDLAPLAAPIVLGILAGSVTSYIEQNPYLVGASGAAWQHGIVDRLALAGQTSWFYVGKLLAPHPYILEAPQSLEAARGTMPLLVQVPAWLRDWLPQSLCFNYPKWELDAGNPFQWAGTAAMIVVVGVLWAMRHRLGRGALACVLIYLGCLFPAMGFVNVFPMQFSWVADHFAYVASIGLIVLFAAAVSWGTARIPDPVRLGVAAAVVGVLGFFTIQYATTFRDATTLWTATTLRNDRSWLAAANLGGLWQVQAEVKAQEKLRQGLRAEADRAYVECGTLANLWLKRALKINPDAYQAEYQLARLYRGLRQVDEAMRHASLADEIATRTGSLAYVYPKLLIGELLMQKGENARARQIFVDLQELESKIADKLPTRFADARMRVAAIDLEQLSGEISPKMSDKDSVIVGEVIQTLAIATEIAPNWPPPRLQLARILIDLGKVSEASQEILQVVTQDRNNPDAKYVNALALMKMRDYQAAGAQLSNLIQMEPGNVQARVLFAESLRNLKRNADAIDQLNHALKVEPGDEAARKLLIELGGTPPALTTAPTTLPATLPSGPPAVEPSMLPTTGPAMEMK